jgi:hypothetical protein
MSKPTSDEIEEVIGNVTDQIAQGGSRYPGMSYEEGVDEALRWVQGNSDNTEWPFGND